MTFPGQCPRTGTACIRGECEIWVDGGDSEACAVYYIGELAAVLCRLLESLPIGLNLLSLLGKAPK